MKKILISIFAIIFVISMITVVHAASGSISLTPSANQVAKGNTFTVTLSATADENITGLESALSYDTSRLSLESKSAGQNFSDLSGSNEEIAIASTNNENLSTSATLYTLTFKVLDTAEEGTATINVINATLALINSDQTQENVTVTDTSANVTIVTDTTTAGGQNGNGNGTGNSTGTQNGNGTGNGTGTGTNAGTIKTPSINDNTSGSTTPINSSSSNFDDSDSGKELPQTGVEIGSIIAIAGLSICALISYMLYRKYNI